MEKQKGIFGDTTWFAYRYEVNGMVYETSASSLEICRKARDKWMYLQPIITQYFIDNKSEIWLLFLIAHSKR